MRTKKVLLTGGSGLLGQALLACAPAGHVIGLWHNTELDQNMIAKGAQLTPLRGDLRRPRLGLSTARYQELCAEIDGIVHVAAVTKFTSDHDMLHDTNTEGTRNIVELARVSGARLVHVSTAYVMEGVSAHGAASSYEATKRAAEDVVKSLLGATILRPSIIIGDSHHGRAAAYQGWHQIAGALMTGTLPFLPSAPESICDFVAQDWVADAAWRALRHARRRPELWVTSGQQAMRVQEVVDRAVEIGRRLGFDPAPIKFVPYDMVERLILPVFLKSLPERMARTFQGHLKLAHYMNQTVPFPSSEPLLQCELGTAPREPLSDVFERNLLAWAQDMAQRRQRSSAPAVASAASAQVRE